MEKYQHLCELLNSVCTHFLYGDDQLLCNDFMKLNLRFLLNAFCNNKLSRETIVIHPGTDRLLPLSVLLLSVLSIIEADEIDVDDFFSQFQTGDMVVRDGERFHFGWVDDKCCVLLSDNNSVGTNNHTKIPLASALNIRPYRGQAVTTGRSKNSNTFHRASDFLKDILGNDYAARADVLPRCILVLCERSQADDIANKLFAVEEKKPLYFADIFPCVWAQGEDEWIYFLGNVGKSEPVVVFTNRVHIARDIMFNDEDGADRIFATIVSNKLERTTEQDIYDLRELIERKQSGIFLLLHAERNLASLESFQYNTSSDVLFWTSDLLLSTLGDLFSTNVSRSKANEKLTSQLRHTVNSDVERVLVPCSEAVSHLKDCKQLLKKLIRMHSRNESINEFILCAYGLLNLFEQACFPLKIYEEAIEVGEIRARSPKAQLIRLYELADNFEENDEYIQIAVCLDEAYLSLYDMSTKHDALIDYLCKAESQSIRTCVVVTKKSYLPVSQKIFAQYSNVIVKGYTDYSEEIIDRIIYTSTPNPKKDSKNPLCDKRAESIIILEYPSEKGKSEYYLHGVYRNKSHVQAIADKCACAVFDVDIEDDLQEDSTSIKAEEAEDIENVETELANIETEAIISHATLQISNNSANTTIKAVRLVQFVTGKCAMLSKHYKAYVVQDGALVEKTTCDLQIGDEVIFSESSTEMSDIIDELLKRLIIKSNDETLKKHYERSLRWKSVIQTHIQRTKASWSELSDAMEGLGHKRHPQTIRHWLDEDSSTIGPHDAEAYLAIGLVADDPDMQENFEQYKESCDFIRRQRTKILNYLQDSAIHSVNQEITNDNTLSKEEMEYLGDPSRFAQRLIIERIVPCERDVPSYLANRPLEGR